MFILRPSTCLHDLIPPARPLFMATRTMIVMRKIRILRPTSPSRSTIWQFDYLHCNYWKSKSMVSSVSSSCALRSVILTQVSIKATMGSCTADTHQCQDDGRLINHIVFEVVNVPLLTTTSWKATLASHERIPTYSRLNIDPRRPLMSTLRSEMAFIVRKFGTICANKLAPWSYFSRLHHLNPWLSIF